MGLYYLQLDLISEVIYQLLKLYYSVHVKAVLHRMWQPFSVINEVSRNEKRVGKTVQFLNCRSDGYRNTFMKHRLFYHPLIHFFMCLNIKSEASNFGKVNEEK